MPENQNPTPGGACPSQETLIAYKRGQLPGALLEAVAGHIGQCPACDEALNRLQTPEEDTLVRNLRQFISPDHLSHRTGEEALATTAPAAPYSSAPDGAAIPVKFPCRLGRYELLEPLGRGGMGVVYKARQIDLDRLVALKVAFGGLPVDGEALARFRRESEVIARLRHANIVHVYDCGEHAGQLYFSMELLEGGTLADRLAGRPLPQREAALLVQTLARAVQHAHQAEIIHRDLKPSNVLLGAGGEVKLSDFGLAKLLDADGELTLTDAFLGTPSYTAPEQARGEARTVGRWTDVYGLGAILYQTLTGAPPFRGTSRSQTLEQVRTQPPRPPSRLRPGLSRDLEAICLKCLEKAPQQRYPSAAALAEDLERWLNGQPTLARPLRWPQGVLRSLRRHPIGSSLAALVGIAALVSGLVAVLTHPDFPLWKIERQLTQGQAIVLIGERGEPRWFRSCLRSEPGQVPDPPADYFLVRSRNLALVELIPDPKQDAYRFRAEVKHFASQGGGEVGLYVAHEQPGNQIHQLIPFSFNDIGDPTPLWIPEPRGKTWIKPALPPTPVRLIPRALLLEKSKLLAEANFQGREAPLCVPSGPIDTASWRKLVIEVTPQEVRAFWGDEGQPLDPLSLEAVAVSAEKTLANLRARTPDSSLGKCVHGRFAPRGGLGLYVFRGAAFFRRAVLEPLQPAGLTNPD